MKNLLWVFLCVICWSLLFSLVISKYVKNQPDKVLSQIKEDLKSKTIRELIGKKNTANTITTKNVIDTCSAMGLLVTGEGDMIQSPQFPSEYPNNANCIWTIRAPTNKYIHLVADVFALEYEEDCLYDSLKIFDGDDLFGVFCGTEIRDLISSGTEAELDFHTDSSVTAGGFQFTVYFLNSPDDVTSLPISDDPCDGMALILAEQSFTSPNYPSLYPDNAECYWKIQAPDDKVILLETEYFSLEGAEGCIFDRVLLYDGTLETGELLGVYCGEMGEFLDPPDETYSTESTMTVSFFSDSSIAYWGFVFSVSFIDDSDRPDTTDPCEDIQMLDEEVEFYSPLYPEDYPNGAYCRWWIHAPISKYIHLEVLDFELEDQSSCGYDALQVYDGSSESGSYFGSFCGGINSLTAPGDIVSSSNNLFVIFTSDGSATERGFLIQINFLDTEEPVGPCAGVAELDIDGAYLSSPNFPNNYPNNAECYWKVVAPIGMFVYLATEEFRVENADRCQFDALTIYDGGSESADVIGVYCGSLGGSGSLPIDVLSTSHQLYLEFLTDGSVTAMGFQFMVQFWTSPVTTTPAPGGCPDTPVSVAHSETTLTTPNYPNNYPTDVSCSWLILAPAGSTIQLVINSFDLESNCAYDFLAVYDGSTSDHPLIDKYCGEWDPSDTVLSTSNTMFMEFVSDGSIVGSGFSITILFNDVSPGVCSQTAVLITDDATNILSPNYPLSYPNGALCRWHVQAPLLDDMIIHLLPMEFSLEQSSNCQFDSLKVFDGDSNTSPLLGSFCGLMDSESDSSMPSLIESQGQDLYLEFKSDSSVVNTGFSIDVRFVNRVGVCPENDVIVTQSGSSITSPFYPDPYPNNAECHWIISAPANKIIVVEPIFFELESNAGCTFDSVKFYDGPDPIAALLGIYCGSLGSSSAPTLVRSSASTLYMTFTSDYTDVYRGFNFIVEFVSVSVSTTPPIISDCGVPAIRPIRIIGGLEARPNSWPWQVSIRSFDGRHFCGGSVIDEYWIITAAHCVAGEIPGVFYVVVGDHDVTISSTQEKRHEVDFYIMHRDFDPGTVDNDIAMIRVEEEIDYSLIVSPVCLPLSDVPAGTMCIVTGWGDMSESVAAEKLMQVNQSIISQEQCRDSDWNGEAVTDNMMCAGFQAEGRGPCFGDSGGPLVCESGGIWTLYGLVSWGFECAGFQKPAIYTRVSQYQQWIEDVISGEIEPVEHTCDGLENPTEYDDPSGEIMSPGFEQGQLYTNHLRCSWRIETDNGKSVTLKFESFAVEAHIECAWDKLIVYDGPDIYSPVLGRFCGHTLPGDVIGYERTMYITFVSDDSRVDEGFHITYTTDTASERPTTTPRPTAGPVIATPNADCGIPYYPPDTITKANRIVGGEEAAPNTWPWQVDLRFRDIHFCGGSLIHQEWVVTAAHCVFSREDPDEWSITLRDHNIDAVEGPEQTVQLEEIIIHESYGDRNVNNDIALMKLSEAIVFDSHASHICVPNADIADDTLCYTTGWGTTSGDLNPDLLNQAAVHYIEPSRCNETDYDGLITDKMVCAGDLLGGPDACQGDSGGPLVCEFDGAWRLYGITSWGEGCGLPNYPGVYTRVAVFDSWIASNTGGDVIPGS